MKNKLSINSIITSILCHSYIFKEVMPPIDSNMSGHHCDKEKCPPTGKKQDVCITKVEMQSL